jgi:hypothetical protein
MTLTRRELYNRVWTVPRSRVAIELTISAIGLAKACRRHSIPVPGRGYWQRLAAGLAPQRPLLTGDAEGPIDIQTRPTREGTADGRGREPSAALPEAAPEQAPVNEITIPARLPRHDVVLRATANALCAFHAS